ncbi:plastidic ATP/ADP-transporter-like protein [Trifolium pratense]|uniref:ADP,ATP carrier protein n=1 Tax=Trifolium pratense TaxID=57577 RepID=A0A2K3JN41_TRIPR|nr:plastidic ATP/ADP-transporter-like protein [Trifolium pratense]
MAELWGSVVVSVLFWGLANQLCNVLLKIVLVATYMSVPYKTYTLAPVIGKLGSTPLLAAVYVGALQNIFSKSAKYSLFDPCKEMAYIPLDEDTKVERASFLDEIFVSILWRQLSHLGNAGFDPAVIRVD